MKVLLQRVNHASVTVNSEITGKIGKGLLLLTGIGKDDTTENLQAMTQKLIHLRIFPDEQGRFHYSLLDIEGEALLVPQFTLYGDTNKGRRPDFFEAMPPQIASPLFDDFTQMVKDAGVKNVQTGVFGADMKVALENDGPVTLLLEY